MTACGWHRVQAAAMHEEPGKEWIVQKESA